MSAQVAGIQPNVLSWARETIGLSISDVAIKLKRTDDEILSWEQGESAPTYPQLEKLAYDLYKRPLAVFFLPNPPQETLPETEFRTLPEADLHELQSDTYLHIRNARAYQLSLQEVFEDSGELGKRIWEDIKLDVANKDIVSQAQTVREYLNLDMAAQSSWKNTDEALKAWRKRFEAHGVFVFKSSFKQKEISGFCLFDKNFPLIYLNNSTTKTRQIFSLLHELAHLLLNINSLSKFDKSYISQLPSDQKRVEVFCNAIAAEILIPSSEFQSYTAHLPHNIEQQGDVEIEKLAGVFGVSREVILRLFLDLDRVGESYYLEKKNQWDSQRKGGSGGNYYATQNIYLSQKFAQAVVRLHYQHKISVAQASEYLGIKAKSFLGLEQRILSGAEH